jgi:hypothetical protein
MRLHGEMFSSTAQQVHGVAILWLKVPHRFQSIPFIDSQL